jgi:phenylpropionate dioxygenase-like ring-hydroxylating dioxygenase large terminal subunit
MRRVFSFLVLLGLIVGMAVPAGASGGDEVRMFELVNQTRVEAGLEPLGADIPLIVSARGHTSAMIETGDLFHSTSAEMATYGSNWELMGENVGLGQDVTSVHEAFMRSTSHRANVLGEFDRVGVGIDRNSDGTIFVTVVFMRRTPDAPRDDFGTGTMVLIAGLPEFAVSRLVNVADTFHRVNRGICAPLGSEGIACID